MLSKLYSLATVGLECVPIEVEIDIGTGKIGTIIVGLGDTAVQEARYRVSSAIKNSKLHYPLRRITCNLAPADLRKIGPSYDLPLALGILMSSDQIPWEDWMSSCVFASELALNGETRHINGVLSMAIYAKTHGIKHLFLPECNAKEASLIDEILVYPVANLRAMVDHLTGKNRIQPLKNRGDLKKMSQNFGSLDFKYIKGQEQVKRAMEIAASGAHNILLNGSPGSGKTLMARTLQTVLPQMTYDESIEVTRIYSIANLLSSSCPFIQSRPFRCVHHTASDISIVGGGRIPRPGEISLAHKGVLFFDEIGEFPNSVLEVLRQPLEDKTITINRAQGSLSFPAHFLLVAAMNPCPCGYYNVPKSDKECICTAYNIQRYQKKISGPLLDRIDLYTDVSPVKYEKLSSKEYGESSKAIQDRVQKARDIQSKRFRSLGISSNSEMSLAQIKTYCSLPNEAEDLLREAMTHLKLSARGYHRIIKISRTIADLDNSKDIQKGHVAEALQYRKKEEE